jgi:HNH endonuclease
VGQTLPSLPALSAAEGGPNVSTLCDSQLVDVKQSGGGASSKQWLDHRHYRTYEIALGITQAVGGSADLRDLEFLQEAIAGFLLPWQKETAVHRFARAVADEMFVKDTEGPYIQLYDQDGNGSISTRRYLPVDIALRSYGIGDGEMFEVPPPDGVWRREGNIYTWEESVKVANACYDYTVDLQWTAAYDELLIRIADEVFYTIFSNRTLLGRLHEVLAIYVSQENPDNFSDEPEIARLFNGAGKLKRVDPPQWVRRAIFFRDQGHCVMCSKDLTGLTDPLVAAQLDHIVPLELGGLNDLSNLQLLCESCNRRKAADLAQPSTRHRRYYEPDRR